MIPMALFCLTCVPIVDVTNTLEHTLEKTNKLQNIYTIGRGVKNISSKKWKFGGLLINTRPIGPSVTKHIRHITNIVTAD